MRHYYSVCLVNNKTRKEEVLEGLTCPPDWDPEDYFIGTEGVVWGHYDPAEWTAELFGPEEGPDRDASAPGLKNLFGTLVSALDVSKVCGKTCPSCGRDNSEYGDICSADDCPGVISLRSAGQEAKEVNRLMAVAREVNGQDSTANVNRPEITANLNGQGEEGRVVRERTGTLPSSLPPCDSCPAKSADCAYGDLRNSISCQESIARWQQGARSRDDKGVDDARAPAFPCISCPVDGAARLKGGAAYRVCSGIRGSASCDAARSRPIGVDSVLPPAGVEVNTSRVCSVCKREFHPQDEQLVHLSIYAFGSEGIWACMSCRKLLTDLVRYISEVAGIGYLKGFKAGRRPRQ